MAERMYAKPTTRGPAGPPRGPGGGGFGGAGTSGSKSQAISIRMIFSHIVLGTCCFFGGLMAGLSATSNTPLPVLQPLKCPVCPKLLPPPVSLPKAEAARRKQQEEGEEEEEVAVPTRTFPDSLLQMVVDYSTIPRDDFNNIFDIGVPIDDTVPGAEEVLLLHMGADTLPNTRSTNPNSHSLPARQATENCDILKVILHQPARHGNRQCIAIVPQWESYYVHKFMRLPKANNRPLDKYVPLRYVSRAHVEKGTYQRVPDQKTDTKVYYPVLQEYLENLDRLLDLLTPIAQSVADPTTKTIVVLVCNYGQAELFHNFVCNARARGLDLSHLLMFATDEPTLQMCQSLGITAFYDESIFGSMPTSAARAYGDRTFGKMMMAKVFCVHLINSLGYNLLFQDVDVVWHRNPMPYFEQSWIKEEWDLLFQDDGARSQRYAPFSPNTGFYYVKSNPKTEFFFSTLLRMGDVIAVTHSHQAALTSLLNEHVSWKGLRVKVWKRGEYNEFPGGYEYHRGKAIMKTLLSPRGNSSSSSNLVDPYIFHMSWTQNKDNKKLYFEQMGEWYKKENCMSGLDCCLKQPNITCHYRDKPSIKPCRQSPPIDKNKPSFW